MPQVAVLGEALIDLTRARGLSFDGHPGGSPLNTAIAAARLGAASAFVGQLSTDFFGDVLFDHLAGNGVDTRWIERSAAPSTLAFVDRRPTTNRYAFYVEGCADGLWQPATDPQLPEECHFLCHGSFSLIREPAGPRILDFVARESDRRIVVLDPNVRPSLIASPDDYRRRFARWLDHVHLLKLSDEDAAYLAPGLPLSALAGQYLQAGVEAVVVTNGANGAWLFRQGRPTLQSTPPRIEVVDTIGAGDTMTAAVIAALIAAGIRRPSDLALLDEAGWQQVLDFGCMAATLNCTRPGADPPDREAVLEALGARSAR